MKRILVLLAVFTLTATTAWSLTGGDHPAAKGERADEAIAAATAWLGLIDDGKYAESWNTAAAMFRGAVERQKWEKTLTALRKPLGETLSRKVVSTQYKTSLPGAPDGEYVVIRFETSFTAKKKAVETVTPMKEADGKWRVSGYYIK